MESKSWWAWPVLGAAGLVIVRTSYRAFTVPWVWNEDQCLFGFFCVCAVYVAVVYARIFSRGGLDAVKAHLVVVRQMEDPRLNMEAHRRKPLYWITIVVLIGFSVLAVPEIRQGLLDLLH